MTTQRAKSTTRESRTTRPVPARTDARRWGDGGHRSRTGPESSLRARVVAAVIESGKGVDAKTAYEQTKKWFRSGGTEWARRLY
jgi:hypothetical protein